MKSYKYKLYDNKHNQDLHDMCRAAAFVWNHCLALQQRYYRLYHGYISSSRMQSHFAKKVRHRYKFLDKIGSQSIQEVIQRLDTSYVRFFRKTQKRPPKFKSGRTFSSFVFKQAGFRLEDNVMYVNKLKHGFKFWLSRPYGEARTVRLKRSRLGDFYIIITSDFSQNDRSYGKTHDGASVGIDFGLKTFLTLSDGTKIKSPQFFKKNINKIRSLSRTLSRKQRVPTGRLKYSKKYKKMVNETMLSKRGNEARKALCRAYESISDSREDFFYKLAHELCQKYDFIFLETLNLKGMQKLWGRKISDYAHGRFVIILKEVALKYGVVVHQIDRWYPSSKTCSECGNVKHGLTLKDREYICENCGVVIDRDVNAAINIERQGIAEYLSGSKSNKPEGLKAAVPQEG